MLPGIPWCCVVHLMLRGFNVMKFCLTWIQKLKCPFPCRLKRLNPVDPRHDVPLHQPMFFGFFDLGLAQDLEPKWPMQSIFFAGLRSTASPSFPGLPIQLPHDVVSKHEFPFDHTRVEVLKYKTWLQPPGGPQPNQTCRHWARCRKHRLWVLCSSLLFLENESGLVWHSLDFD